MQAVVPDSPLLETARRPAILELSAAGLLVASVVLHVVAVIPKYYGGAGQGSLSSEPDQAAEYALLAAGWALAVALLALPGPRRARLGTALAVGLAATEFGFRLSDLGEVFRYGSGAAAAGLWLMTAAWVVGAAGAVMAVLAVRARRPPSEAPGALDGGSWTHPAAPALASPAGAPSPSAAGSIWPAPPPALAPPPPVAPLPPPLAAPPRPGASPDATASLAPARLDRTESLDTAAPDPTRSLVAASGPLASPDSVRTAAGSLGATPTVLIALLAIATAGAFLPAWDHYAGVATTTGRGVSFNLGNGFSGPWQVVIGTILVAVALAAIPVLATRLPNRAAGTAFVAGALIVLATQFTAAVVQVDRAVPPSVAGLNAAQANQLGLQLHMTLTGWFTFDLLAAFALFVAVMVLSHVREPDSLRAGVGPAYAHPTAGARRS